MDSRRKLRAVSARLGPPRESRPDKGEYGFMCPGRPGRPCTSAEQGKIRLWVNPELDTFHCWHCGYGNGGSLASLMVRGSSDQREYAEEVGERTISARPRRPPCTALPDGYMPFGLGGSLVEAPYLHYLRGRGVSDRTVGLYRMGYAASGELAGRVVVPSFDAIGSVNFWSARSIYPDPKVLRYRLPMASKDVVSNEHMVDWNSPVYIVEGIFDEVAIGPQAISLYGKFMPSQLALRLVEKRPPVVYICLDSDAWAEAVFLATKLIGYDLACAIVELGGKDPGIVGGAAVVEAASRSRAVTGMPSLLGARL